MHEFEFKKNHDGTYVLIIYLKAYLTEFADEEMKKANINDILEKCRGKIIKTVKLVFLSGAVLSLPFSSFAQVKKNDDKYIMSYVYFGNTLTQIHNVKKSSNVINTVSPSYFNLNDNGSLEDSNISLDFVSQMHKIGLKVVPFLSNHWDKTTGIMALLNREALSQAIADSIEKYNLDGVNVDIENVNENYRDAYTDFVRLLREKIPEEKEVSVAVAANPYGWKTGWHGSYDYEKLGRYADHIFIMAYDEHYEGGEAGPVASLKFVRESIEYALEYVSPEKIVIGVPFFGRLWGENVYGKGVSLSHAKELIETYKAVVYYDTIENSPVATFSVTKNSPAMYINGVKLSEGNYTLWFEDENSLREKFKLISEYDLKGIGNWSAGQENDDIWDYYELWTKGVYFNDILGHFAKDDILKIYSKGYMIGKDENSFSPEGKLTRGQAAVILARVLDIEKSNKSAFNDTLGHFAEGYINALYEKGLIKGYGDKSFKPDSLMTRAEMAAMLAKILEYDYKLTDEFFYDVKKSHWAFSEITALAKAGILKGYEDGSFKPFNYLTRAEAAVLINRLQS